jgi:DNA-binding transcriptional regulator YhcF (GntR family)
MDQHAQTHLIESYVRQQLQAGQPVESVIDVARQLDVPVTMVDRAMRNLSAQGLDVPYQNASEF